MRLNVARESHWPACWIWAWVLACAVHVPVAGGEAPVRLVRAESGAEPRVPGDQEKPPEPPKPVTPPVTPAPPVPLPPAEVLEMGENGEWLVPAQTAKRAWSMSEEEAPASPAPRMGPRPGDPEFRRSFPLDTAREAPDAERREAPVASGFAPRRGDPEFARSWPADAGSIPTLLRALTPAAGAPTARDVDRPRFAWGEGLDDPRAQVGATPLARPLSVPAETPPAAGAQPGPTPAPRGTGGEIEAEAALRKPPKRKLEPKEELPTPPSLSEILKQEQRKGPVKNSEELDDRLSSLLKVIEHNKQMLKERTPDKPSSGPPSVPDALTGERGTTAEDEGEYIETDDPQALRALQFFLQDRPRGILQGVVLDQETRQPIPARVKIVDASDLAVGAPLPGVGFWCNGQFRVPVASGKVRIEVSAGRYRSTFLKGLEVEAGKVATVEAVLARPRHMDFAFQGWYLADLNLALNADRGDRVVWGGKRPNLADAVLAAYAEGVQILGAAQPWGLDENQHPPHELLDFFDELQGPRLLLLPAFRGPRHPFCGNVLGVGMTGWNDLPPHLNDPRQSLRDHLEDLRSRGALTVFTDLTGLRSVDPQRAILPLLPRLAEDGYYRTTDRSARLYAPTELPFATVTGPAYDALAFDGSESARRIWFNLLDEGYTVSIVGASGGSLEAGRVPYGQTFVHMDGLPTRDKVVAALRGGHATVSFGPALFVKVFERDRGPGDRLPADGRPLQLQIQAYASLAQGARLDRIEILRNGVILHNEKVTEGLTLLQDFRFPFREEHNAWYVVRAVETSGQHQEVVRDAWTNPIYFDSRGRERPQPAQCRARGVLRDPAGTPLKGRVCVLEPGVPTREVPIGPDGRFDVRFQAAGALLFHAHGYQPLLRKPFEDPKVQKALGGLQTDREGKLVDELAKRSVFGFWRLLLSELDSDIRLEPTPVSAPSAPAEPALVQPEPAAR
ncbi:MAG: hypothetical protein AMXMBFR7_05400 [Planctomycetota bacterium]